MADDLRRHLQTVIAARTDGSREEVDQILESTLRRLAWRQRRGHKRCVTCGEDKKPAEFGPDGGKPDGLSNRCRKCDRARKRRD